MNLLQITIKDIDKKNVICGFLVSGFEVIAFDLNLFI